MSTLSGLSEDEVPSEAVLQRVTIPMLNIMDQLVADLHRHDSPHNHHLCILVREWHYLLGLEDDEIQASLMALIESRKSLDTTSQRG